MPLSTLLALSASLVPFIVTMMCVSGLVMNRHQMSLPVRLALSTSLTIFIGSMMALSGLVMNRHLDSPGWGAMAGELILALFWAIGLSVGALALCWSIAVLAERTGPLPVPFAVRRRRIGQRNLAFSLLLAIALTAAWQVPAEIQRRRAADYQATPEELRRIYAESAVRGRIEVLAALAVHRNTPSEILLDMAVAEDPIFDRPRRNLIALFQGPPRSIRQLVASRSATPPEGLSYLAENGTPGVLEVLAWNPQTPPATLLRLSSHSSSAVLRPVARNPRTPARALELLAEHSDTWIRAGVAAHRETAPRLLIQLAADTTSIVRHRVATNPRTPLRTLDLLAVDSDHEIRRLAQEARDRITSEGQE